MRLGMNLFLWTTHVTEEHFPLLGELAECGYEGVEIPTIRGDVAHYREILRASPDDGDAHFNLAKAYARKGELQLAARHYEATLALASDDADAHFNLGRVLRALGRDAEATAHFSESQRLDPAGAT